jgi:hypothetical protein
MTLTLFTLSISDHLFSQNANVHAVPVLVRYTHSMVVTDHIQVICVVDQVNRGAVETGRH